MFMCMYGGAIEVHKPNEDWEWRGRALRRGRTERGTQGETKGEKKRGEKKGEEKNRRKREITKCGNSDHYQKYILRHKKERKSLVFDW